MILDSFIIFGNNKPQNSHSSSKQQRGLHKCLVTILRPQNMYQHIMARNRLTSQTLVKQRSEENIYIQYRPTKNLQPLPNVTTARIECPSRFMQWEYIDAIRVVKADQCRLHKSRRTWIRSEDLATCAKSAWKPIKGAAKSRNIQFTSYIWKTKQQNGNATLQGVLELSIHPICSFKVVRKQLFTKEPPAVALLQAGSIQQNFAHRTSLTIQDHKV